MNIYLGNAAAKKTCEIRYNGDFFGYDVLGERHVKIPLVGISLICSADGIIGWIDECDKDNEDIDCD